MIALSSYATNAGLKPTGIANDHDRPPQLAASFISDRTVGTMSAGGAFRTNEINRRMVAIGGIADKQRRRGLGQLGRQ
jgi:hypothetical protein